MPSGPVTLLFTDIEGFPRLWEKRADETRPPLARHDVLLRSAIEGGGGDVFKTVGDAFCAAFARAIDALEAAVAAQRALAEEAWPGGIAIRARMGLHSGVCDQRDGDYFGPTVNRSARLEGALGDSMINGQRSGNPTDVINGIFGLALCATARGEDRRAASLHGASQALLDANEEVLDPLEAGMAKEDHRRLMQRMGAEGLASAFAAGSRLTPQDAMAEALKESGDPR